MEHSGLVCPCSMECSGTAFALLLGFFSPWFCLSRLKEQESWGVPGDHDFTHLYLTEPILDIRALRLLGWVSCGDETYRAVCAMGSRARCGPIPPEAFCSLASLLQEFPGFFVQHTFWFGGWSQSSRAFLSLFGPFFAPPGASLLHYYQLKPSS